MTREGEAPSPVPHLARLGTIALIVLPAALTAYLSFHAGGFFPATSALVALVLGQIMVLRTMSAEAPFAGYSCPLAIASTAFALYALWGLGSALWSDALGRALVEFDRILMYLLILVLFGSMRWTYRETRWMVRALTLSLVAVCVAALMSRVLPDVLVTTPGLANNRLSYPLTYWNALGLVAALGVVFCLFLASDERGGAWVRALAAAGLPVTATTLYFTFSRGAIAACIIAVLVFVLVARPRGLLGGVLAGAGPVAISLVSAYHATLLSSATPTSPAAVVQGHHVAAVVGACALGAALLRLLLVPLDARLARLEAPSLSRRTTGLVAGGALLLAIVAIFATGLSGEISRGYHDFFHREQVTPTTDLRARLTDPSANGRIEHWRVALDAFGRSPIKGTGLGTFEIAWSRDRPVDASVINAHSIYVETLSDLGLVGGLFFAIALATILGAFARRARGPDRALFGTLLAAGAAWALHNAVDWDWQMPATTAWFFALGGVALSSRPRTAAAPAGTRQQWRLVAGVGWLALLVTPVLVFLSQSRLHTAARAFTHGSCAQARDDALSSISALNVRPEPYEILAYCDMEDGDANTAVRAMRNAAELDPRSWETSYGLALALASAGRDPSRPLRQAMQRNPRLAVIRSARPGLESANVARRQDAARRARVALLNSGQLSIGAR
jgi:hypothetical protein